MTDTSWQDIQEQVQSTDYKKWNSDKLTALALIIRMVTRGQPVDEQQIIDVIHSFNEPEDTNPYADAIELGNQVIAESPYPYQAGSVYLKDYNGNPGFRKGGLYAGANQNYPITQAPDENCLKFRTPVEGERGELQDPVDFKGVNLNKYKWNPWLYPHNPNFSNKETHNILKTLEYGYMNLPKGKHDGGVKDEFTEHSPHLVVLYTGHE